VTRTPSSNRPRPQRYTTTIMDIHNLIVDFATASAVMIGDAVINSTTTTSAGNDEESPTHVEHVPSRNQQQRQTRPPQEQRQRTSPCFSAIIMIITAAVGVGVVAAYARSNSEEESSYAQKPPTQSPQFPTYSNTPAPIEKYDYRWSIYDKGFPIKEFPSAWLQQTVNSLEDCQKTCRGRPSTIVYLSYSRSVRGTNCACIDLSLTCLYGKELSNRGTVLSDQPPPADCY